MLCVLCEKNLLLGVTSFTNEQSPENDPLSRLFEDELFSYQNPETKQSENRPIFDIITSRSGARDIPEKSFKMFPPVILPPANIPHGFPKHFPENLQNFEDEDKKKWFNELLVHEAESAVSLAFEFLFLNSQGFMIQNYHPETYLQPLVVRGKKQREDLAHKGQVETHQLSHLQDKICQALGAVGPHNKEAYIRELGDRNRETDNIII